MSRIQSKITQLTKEQENRTNSQVKMQPTDLNPQITQMLESLDFKAVIIIFGQEGKLNTFEMNERLRVETEIIHKRAKLRFQS